MLKVASEAKVGMYGLLKGFEATTRGVGPRAGWINSYASLRLAFVTPDVGSTGCTALFESKKKTIFGVKP